MQIYGEDRTLAFGEGDFRGRLPKIKARAPHGISPVPLASVHELLGTWSDTGRQWCPSSGFWGGSFCSPSIRAQVAVLTRGKRVLRHAIHKMWWFASLLTQHPHPFWHQGLVPWKTILPRTGWGGAGMVQAEMRAMGSRG